MSESSSTYSRLRDKTKQRMNTIKGTFANIGNKLGNKSREIGVNDFFSKIKNFMTVNKYPLTTLLFLIVFIAATIVVYKYSSINFFQDYSTYLFIGIGILLFFGILVFVNQSINTNKPKVQANIKQQLFFFLKYILMFGLGFGILIGIMYGISSSSFISIALLYISFFAACILGLYLLHSLIKNMPFFKSIENSKIFSIIYHLVFLIPCILVDGGRTLFGQMKTTSSFIYKILLAEIVLISAYFLIPKLSSYILKHDAIVLQDKPVYLDKERVLGTFEDLKQNDSDDFKYSYGLSLWCFIDQNLPNANNKSTKDVTILNYGMKPKITYNSADHELKIIMRKGIDGQQLMYKTKDFKLQKWNNIVINYDHGVLDVIINGTLVASHKGIVPYMKYDNVTMPVLKPGIHGGIKQVYY